MVRYFRHAYRADRVCYLAVLSEMRRARISALNRARGFMVLLRTQGNRINDIFTLSETRADFGRIFLYYNCYPKRGLLP